MYTLVSAIGEPLGGGHRWREVSIGEMSMATIFSTYANVIATLSNPFLSDPVALDLQLIRTEHGTKSITFNELLVSLGDAALPTTGALPQLNTQYARYADAFHAGYKVAPIHPTWAPDAEGPEADRTWLRLTRPDTDYALFKKHCMVSINGFYHQMDADANGIYITEGNRSRWVSGLNTIGILSFRRLGQLRTIPITTEMVYKQAPEQGLRHRAYLNVGEDLSGKVVMLVLGGYLHVLDDNTLRRTSDTSLLIDMENLPLFERYYESRQFLDLTSLQLETTEVNPWQIGVEDFLSDAVLTRYLTLPQSFLVVLDNPNVFVDYAPVHQTKMPGMFISFVRPDWPLLTGYGLHTNYWYTYEDRQWSLTSVHGVVDNPVFHTVDAKQERGIIDSRTPELRRRLAGAKFMQIGCDLL